MRIMLRILSGLIPEITRVFLDDISIKGPYSDYGGEEVMPGIRKFIAEYIHNVDQVLLYIKLVGYIIKIPKS